VSDGSVFPLRCAERYNNSGSGDLANKRSADGSVRNMQVQPVLPFDLTSPSP
jgi:hypothetical protein